MKILSHRGYWKEEKEKNTIDAVRKAFDHGFGIESDIRDLDGKLVISHNPADSACPMAEDVFELMRDNGDKYCFAINIKADGLKGMLGELLSKYQIDNYFTFDMSVPQMLEYREKGIRYYTRQSEYEKEPVLYHDAAGVWADAFEDDQWITEELIRRHLENGKTVCIVSPDLHNRDNLEFWNRLVSYELNWEKVMLCTDRPDDAKEYFREFIDSAGGKSTL